MKGRLGVLLRKEFLELRADRRALLLSVFLPVLLYPLILIFTSTLEKKGEASQDRLPSRVAVRGEFGALLDSLSTDGRWDLVELGPDRDPTSAIESADLDLVIFVERDFGSEEEPGQASLRLVHSGTRERSRRALRRARDLLEDLEQAESRRRQLAAGADGELDTRYTLEDFDIATAEESSGAKAGGQIVYLLLMTLFVSGSALASDLIAGEKERGTLETLYLVPRPRGEIAISKVVVVVAGTSLSGVLSLLSISGCYVAGLMDHGGASSSFSILSLLAAGALVLPLATLLSGVLLAISTHARSLKEAQQMLMPAMLLCFGAGLLTYSQAVELSPVTAFIPVANVALAMRDVLAGQIVAPLVALTSLASLFWAWLILRWVTQQLGSEEMILGFDPEPLLARTRGGRRRATLLALAVAVLAYFYAGSLVQARLGVRGVLLSLWILLPLLGLSAWRFVAPSTSLRSLISLRLPAAAAWPAALLLALGTLLPMMGGYMRLQELALPSPSSGLAEMEALFSDLSLWQVFVLGSLSPAICEEFVFRGVFLGLLRRFGKPRAAVVTTAVFFGLIHLSVFRFVPTAALGLILALLVVRTGSILPSMLFHAVYNGSLLLGGAWVAEHGAPIDLQGPVAWALSLFALVGGATLLRGVRAPE